MIVVDARLLLKFMRMSLQLKQMMSQPQYIKNTSERQKIKKKAVYVSKITKKWFIDYYPRFDSQDIETFITLGVDIDLLPKSIYSIYLVKKKGSETFNLAFYNYISDIYKSQTDMRDIVIPD